MPPILRLPSELHIRILSYLESEVPKCCLTGFLLNPFKRKKSSWYDRDVPKPEHDESSDHDTETVTVTHPAVLMLRSTHPYFSNLIPLSQTLLLQVVRHRLTPRSKLGPLLGPLGACCVCLRLRPSHEFAIRAPSEDPQNVHNHALWTLECGAKYRFCRDCGFRTYPHPHPALSPRRQQRQRGHEPVQMTTYKPGTKVVFPRWSNESGLRYLNYQWCLDCRLLKTSTRPGYSACPMFCRDCCLRLNCMFMYHPIHGARVSERLHQCYAGIESETVAEKQRHEQRSGIGAVYIAQGSSLLIRNVEQPVCDDEEDEDLPENSSWNEWFDLEGYPTVLPTPPADWIAQFTRERKFPSYPVQISCTLIHSLYHNIPLGPFVHGSSR